MLECKQISSLTKVFADQAPQTEYLPISILRGETASCQVAVQSSGDIRVTAAAPGFRVTLREVGQVPVIAPCNPDLDDPDYLRTVPGLYPDTLLPMGEDGICHASSGWKAIWIDAEPEVGTPSGDYTLNIRVENLLTGETFSAEQRIQFVDCALPAQKLLHTEWFHCDCLADYYHVEPFSEEHWTILEHFLRSAVRLGINMILTPIFTPPLDTQVGGERTTVQLVDVIREKGQYRFGFDKLERWIRLCQNCGITHFEMAHLYSQWGSNRAPKIMAVDDGVYRRIFGWETEATGSEYAAFLACFLPALTEKLRELGVAEQCRFHISDEPKETQLPCYAAQKQQVAPYVKDFAIMDALSEYEFYRQGVVQHPVVATDSNDLPKFLADDNPDLWLYYCCGQQKDVSNRFIAMPSARTRILGVQLYLLRTAGFLQWGFNFYNAGLSIQHIDPYTTTDGNGAFIAGDPFIVYPGPDGQPVESIRYMAFRQALHDLRSLELLESLAGRERVEALISQDLSEPLTLSNYPRTNDYLPRLRLRINQEIEKFRKA